MPALRNARKPPARAIRRGSRILKGSIAGGGVLLTNSFDGITPSGTAVTTVNSGGASGNGFNATHLGTGCALTSDSTHAHGSGLSCHLTTGATPAALDVTWSTSMGTQSQWWFRLYLYFTANPAAMTQVYVPFNVGGSTQNMAIIVNTTGTLRIDDSASTAIFTTTTSIGLNQWVRVEGFVTGSATTGQVEVKLFNTADSLTPDETLTSAATRNTNGPSAFHSFGTVISVANVSYWQDDLGLSSSGYLGPAGVPDALSPALRQKTGTRRGDAGARAMFA